ncbi:MAG: hypothetical protein NUV61_01630 [Candidatus Azambacteria bacterium]|nr:hypothetical protein [Candidatus Azambacteria bacterium]
MFERIITVYLVQTCSVPDPSFWCVVTLKTGSVFMWLISVFGPMFFFYAAYRGGIENARREGHSLKSILLVLTVIAVLPFIFLPLWLAFIIDISAVIGVIIAIVVQRYKNQKEPPTKH